VAALGGSALPSLSQIHGWDTAHLEDAATHWSSRAWEWEDAFTDVHQRVLFPGGTPWRGIGADSAFLRTGTDKVAVSGIADSLHAAAAAAREGAGDISWAKRSAIQAVEQAQAQGFTVGEDLSVTDRSSAGLPAAARAARQLQAQTLATDIRAQAQNLVAVDTQVATRITTAIAGLNTAQFADAGSGGPPGQGPDRPDPSRKPQSKIELVDSKFSPTPDDGGGGGAGQPIPQHPEYPNRNIKGQYGAGNSADGKLAEQQALDKLEAESGVPIIRQQVKATQPGVLNPDGTPQGRFYDGLQETGVPGEYFGIEAKSPGVNLTGPQSRFDTQVSPENPATAILNGQPVKIVGTQVVYPSALPSPGVPAEPAPSMSPPVSEPIPEPPVISGGGPGMSPAIGEGGGGAGGMGGMGGGGHLEEMPGLGEIP
jgi:hypothetical protein